MYDQMEKEVKDIEQAIQLGRTVSTVPSSTENVELGDAPTPLRRLENVIEAHLHRA
jgi:hypothetical protein